MAAKGRIVNTTPKGKHSIERTRFTVIHSGGTYSKGRNAEKRAVRTPTDRMHMLADRRLRQLDGRRYG